jgi:putative acetyltransferase
MEDANYPEVVDASLVGEYSAVAKSGGGYVWDEVLEYRVWCHPEHGAPDEQDGSDYYYAYETYAEALEASERLEGAEEPIALIRQLEYIEEPEPGEYRHIKKERVTEWRVEFLKRPRRTSSTIPDFLSPSAPANRLDILRGLAKPRCQDPEGDTLR